MRGERPIQNARLREKLGAVRCVACRDDLGAEALASCRDCAIQVHELCLELLRGCPTLGCSGEISASHPASNPPSSGPASRSRLREILRGFSRFSALDWGLFLGLIPIITLAGFGLLGLLMTIAQSALAMAPNFNIGGLLVVIAMLGAVVTGLRALTPDSEDPARARLRGPRAFLTFLGDMNNAATKTLWDVVVGVLRNSLRSFWGALLLLISLPILASLCLFAFTGSTLKVAGGTGLFMIVGVIVALAAWVNRDDYQPRL